jgi:hypothetical protein
LIEICIEWQLPFLWQFPLKSRFFLQSLPYITYMTSCFSIRHFSLTGRSQLLADCLFLPRSTPAGLHRWLLNCVTEVINPTNVKKTHVTIAKRRGTMYSWCPKKNADFRFQISGLKWTLRVIFDFLFSFYFNPIHHSRNEKT